MSLPDEDLYAIYEALGFVADVCESQVELLNVALCRHTVTYYPAHHLRAELLELAGRVGTALGLPESS